MKPIPRWRWPAAHALLDAGDGAVLWLPTATPPPSERARFGLRVEILCWLDDVLALNAALGLLHDHFRRDSVLAAVRRHDNATRFVLQTAAREALAHQRCDAVRAALRPTAFGLRVALEPDWSSVTELVDGTGPAQGRSEMQHHAECEQEPG